MLIEVKHNLPEVVPALGLGLWLDQNDIAVLLVLLKLFCIFLSLAHNVDIDISLHQLSPQ